MKIQKNIELLIISFMCLSINCSGNEFYDIKIEEGVTVVTNHLLDVSKSVDINLTFVNQIGGDNEDDPNYLLFRPADVIVDNDDNVLILDAGNQRIQKYDSELKYIETIGRAGQGPLEFTAPAGFDITDDGKIFVADFPSGKVHIIDPDMTYSSFPWSKPLTFIKTLSNGNLLMGEQPMPEKILSGEDQPQVVIRTQEGTFVSGIGKRERHSDMNTNYFVNFTKVIIDKDDNIYICYQWQNKIEKYSQDGTLLMKFYQSFDFSTEIVEPLIPLITNNIGIDSKNRVWIGTATSEYRLDPGKRSTTKIPELFYQFNIYSEEGILIGNRTIDIDFTNFIVKEDNLFLIDMESMSVYKYKIVG